MKEIYEIVENNPAYFVWAFGVVNVLWGLFMYFNTQAHLKALAELEHRLRLDGDRRLKVFELKVNQYESYVERLDSIGQKQQSELPKRIHQCFNEYLAAFLAASESEDKQEEVKAIQSFASQVANLMNEIDADGARLRSESSRLKLTATEEMLETFAKLESLTAESATLARQMIENLPQLAVSGSLNASGSREAELKAFGVQIQATSQLLMNQMRAELQRM